MKQLLLCEYRKTRRRYILLCALAIIAALLLCSTYGDYSSESGIFMLENGWMNFLYQLPMLNTIFLPILCTVVASRLADVEHRAVSLKQLCAIADKGRLYDAKLLYGLGIVLLCVLIDWIGVIIFGICMGFGGMLPWDLYLLFLLFTAVTTVAVYVISHTLSLLFKNQTFAFFVGIIGTFVGLFSMFLPQVPLLRRCLPWGYYGALQLVGMYGWNPDTRYADAYFAVMDIDWPFFLVLVAMTLLLYMVGRKLFCIKEV